MKVTAYVTEYTACAKNVEAAHEDKYIQDKQSNFLAIKIMLGGDTLHSVTR